MWNVHRMSIKIEHRNLEIRKIHNDFSVQVRNFSVQVWNFLLPLKVLRHKEREAQSFYSGFFICPLPSHVTLAQGLREQAKANHFIRCLVSTLLTNFFKIFPNPLRTSGAWHHSHCLTLFPISGYCDISEWHIHSVRARMNTCVNVAPN